MRMQGVGPTEIGIFIGTLYLPWTWKFVMGPVVDLVYSNRLGPRRGWILLTQVAMSFMLLSTMWVDFTAELKLFTALIFVVNTFGASQDVAIDALACGVLEEHERGLANGLMFGGAYVGQALGGAGVLYLSNVMDFKHTFIVVAGLILTVTVFVTLPMRDPPKGRVPSASGARGRLRAIMSEILQYANRAIRAILGSRATVFAGIFALLPTGAYALSSTLQVNLAVELGLSESAIATLALCSTITSAVCCVIGGLLSDRLGRRRMLAIYITAASTVGLAFATLMKSEGWIMPIDPTAEDRPIAPPVLVVGFWAACLAFAVFHGLLYGTRTALFMDVCNPAVAATQFTAYMSLLNVVIWYTATWQGFAIEKWGYPTTLTIDACAGILCLGTLPFITARTVSARTVTARTVTARTVTARTRDPES